MTGSSRILLVDDDRVFRKSTGALLRQEGHHVREAENGQAAVEALRDVGPFDLILLDLRMPGISGIELVEVLRQWGEGTPILMISGFGTVEAAVQALHMGADDFLTKPVEPDVLSARVAALLERRPTLDAPGFEGTRILGRSGAIRSVLEAVDRVAPTEATVLITGETGTGKELVARRIHEQSERAAGPFVAVNTAALASGVLESELFGHVRGAFTGANRDRKGLFQAAQGGTLFLDEIGEVGPAVQNRLLRVLQEKEVIPVGGDQALKVDVRVVAATNRDLKRAMQVGDFRQDLYYRLNVFRVELPPVRHRVEDIPLLVEHFLAEREPGDGSRWHVSPLAMRLLQAYPWPGNVRELFAVLESAIIRTDGHRIEAQHLPDDVREAHQPGDGTLERYRRDGSETDERTAIVRALEAAGGVRSRAAEMLGMGRTTLWRKMKEYGLVDADADADAEAVQE
jgi:DNA-binding NtrC family response regulator